MHVYAFKQLVNLCALPKFISRTFGKPQGVQHVQLSCLPWPNATLHLRKKPVHTTVMEGKIYALWAQADPRGHLS